jgi:hypothetical protein
MHSYQKDTAMSSIIYLYIKQHISTKLLYFGKTTRNDPERYSGSGTYWKRHIKKHGKHIDTLCVWEFNSKEECKKFALQFSKENNIVESNKWANLIDENLDGVPSGIYAGNKNPMYNIHPTQEAKKKQSELLKKKYNSGELVPWNKGKTNPYSENTLKRMSESHRGQSPANKGKGIYSPEETIIRRRIANKKYKEKMRTIRSLSR